MPPMVKRGQLPQGSIAEASASMGGVQTLPGPGRESRANIEDIEEDQPTTHRRSY